MDLPFIPFFILDDDDGNDQNDLVEDHAAADADADAYTADSSSSSSSRLVNTPSPPPDPKPTVEMTTTLSNSGENVIPTPAGTVRVRPYRSGSTSQLKAVLSFTPRVSSLDRHNVKSQTDEFRGFFTLFWIGGCDERGEHPVAQTFPLLISQT